MLKLVFLGAIILYVFSCFFKCLVNNLPFILKDLPKDIIKFFKYKEYNNFPPGDICAYNGMFGKGKTLTMIHDAYKLYKRYNDKLVWRGGRFVRQKVFIYSNVHLVGIPYVLFTDLGQIVTCAENKEKFDSDNNCDSCYIFIGDEFSSQMNSRNFKNNVSMSLLNKIVTFRHYNIKLLYSSQKWNLTDKLLRDVTQYAYLCSKIWRFQFVKKYDGTELENCNVPALIKPLKKVCWYVADIYYNLYDTKECVQNLDRNDYISDEEHIQLLGSIDNNIDTVKRGSKKHKRRLKRHR